VVETMLEAIGRDAAEVVWDPATKELVIR